MAPVVLPDEENESQSPHIVPTASSMASMDAPARNPSVITARTRRSASHSEAVLPIASNVMRKPGSQPSQRCSAFRCVTVSIEARG